MKRLLLWSALMSIPAAAQDYKIAVIGLVHSHVWGHLGRMAKGEQAKLAGIAETVPELIAEAKKRGAEAPVFSDYKRMLDETKPNIVWAFVENNRHLEIVQACAPRKIHVMFEKPLASTLKDALAIKKLADQHRILVMTNYQMAWWPANYAAKARVDAGDIGNVYRLRGVVGHGGPGGATGLNKWFFAWLTDPVKNGGGSLVDFGCYNALWALWYKGRPTSVYATAQHLRPDEFPKVEDNATIILNWKDGVGIFEASWNLPRSFQDLEVFGRGGSVYMRNGQVELRKGRAEPQNVELPALPPENSEPIAHMIHALRTGKPLGPLVGMDLNIGVVEILEAAKQSVNSGRAIALPLKP
jgi:predicted dehydrogenase